MINTRKARVSIRQLHSDLSPMNSITFHYKMFANHVDRLLFIVPLLCSECLFFYKSDLINIWFFSDNLHSEEIYFTGFKNAGKNDLCSISEMLTHVFPFLVTKDIGNGHACGPLSIPIPWLIAYHTLHHLSSNFSKNR